MKPIPFEIGRVVLSTQGRDRSRLFVVIDVTDDDYVLMADGDLRGVERPKRKKTKHLHAKPFLFPELSKKLRTNTAVLNSELRTFLKETAAQTLPTSKEGCGLVQE